MPSIFDKLRQAGADYGTLLDQAGGDPGEAYNLSEAARQAGDDPERTALANRVAMGADVGGPLSAALLPAYEAAKYLEMKTPVKALSALKAAGVPRVTLPVEGVTSEPSIANALVGALGPAIGGGVRGRRYLDALLRGR